jgi:hypothetical protein
MFDEGNMFLESCFLDDIGRSRAIRDAYIPDFPFLPTKILGVGRLDAYLRGNKTDDR